MRVVVRFAPSPTGYIHIGNARTAFLNWLFAQKEQGLFILRFDDTDRERSKQEYIDCLLDDLAWLGIVPDRIAYQSRRDASYLAAVETLKEKGLLYPCYESEEELQFHRKVRIAKKLPPIYNRKALTLTKEQQETFIQQGRKPYWRFLLPNYKETPFETSRTMVTWEDMLRGTQSVDLSSLSDPVLIRDNGSYLYTLPSVIDDIEFGITHVIRGDDHVTNTAVQISLFQAMEANVPFFAHHNLLIAHSGEALSKRNHVASIRSFREEGIESMVLASFASLAGSSENIVALHSMDDLVQRFSISSFGRSPTQFDLAELKILNDSFFQTLPFAMIQSRLEKVLGSHPLAENFWYAVRGNVHSFSDIISWWKIIFEELETVPVFSSEDQVFLRSIFHDLSLQTWEENIWKQWMDVSYGTLGRKGKNFYEPLRLAITGRTSGPDLQKILSLIGKEKILSRCP